MRILKSFAVGAWKLLLKFYTNFINIHLIFSRISKLNQIYEIINSKILNKLHERNQPPTKSTKKWWQTNFLLRQNIEKIMRSWETVFWLLFVIHIVLWIFAGWFGGFPLPSKIYTFFRIFLYFLIFPLFLAHLAAIQFVCMISRMPSSQYCERVGRESILNKR